MKCFFTYSHPGVWIYCVVIYLNANYKQVPVYIVSSFIIFFVIIVSLSGPGQTPLEELQPKEFDRVT